MADVADLRGDREDPSADDALDPWDDELSDADFEAVLSTPAPQPAPDAEQPTLDSDNPPVVDQYDGWQLLPFRAKCERCGEYCNTADPQQRIRHIECPPDDGLPAGWSWLDPNGNTTAPCDLCGQERNTLSPVNGIAHPECVEKACRRCGGLPSLDNPISKDGECDECVIGDVLMTLRKQKKSIAEMPDVAGWPEKRVQSLVWRQEEEREMRRAKPAAKPKLSGDLATDLGAALASSSFFAPGVAINGHPAGDDDPPY